MDLVGLRDLIRNTHWIPLLQMTSSPRPSCKKSAEKNGRRAGRGMNGSEDQPLDVDVSWVWKIQVSTFRRFMQI